MKYVFIHGLILKVSDNHQVSCFVDFVYTYSGIFLFLFFHSPFTCYLEGQWKVQAFFQQFQSLLQCYQLQSAPTFPIQGLSTINSIVQLYFNAVSCQ